MADISGKNQESGKRNIKIVYTSCDKMISGVLYEVYAR
jgi:hypothetical protein